MKTRYKILTLPRFAALAALRKLIFSEQIALANELGQMNQHGNETLFIDPTATLPTPATTGGANGRWLLYRRGPTGYQYGALANGASLPLGTSEDAPYQVGDVLDVRRLGAVRGIQMGQSGQAITIDDLVYDYGATTPGLIGDLSTAGLGNGTYWVIGRATKTVAAAGQDITFLPAYPYRVTVAGGAFSFAIPS